MPISRCSVSLNYDLSKKQQTEIVDGYDRLVQEKLDLNWRGVILTVMFRPLFGGHSSKVRQMQTQIEAIYSTFLNRPCRPRKSLCDLPLLIGMADLPVSKWKKVSTRDAVVNDGLHYHCVLLVPPKSRLKCTIGHHFEEKADLYLGSNRVVDRIHIEPIVTKGSSLVTDYVLKAIKGKLDYDEHVLILPKAFSEIMRTRI